MKVTDVQKPTAINPIIVVILLYVQIKLNADVCVVYW